MANLPIVGSIKYESIEFSKELPKDVLPTLGDVLRYIMFLREDKRSAAKPKLKPFFEVRD